MDYCTPKISIATSYEDWVAVRNCYVQSFHRYPLYKYIVTDDAVREKFLQSYLDANYDVTVKSGKGILLKMVMQQTNTNENKEKIAGGILFVPPAEDGYGWAIGSDEPYWRAYERYNLPQISPEGYERVKRYEAWENLNVREKLVQARLPLWNGLFCAMLTECAGNGIGSSLYKQTLRLLVEYPKKKMIAQSISSGYNLLMKTKNRISAPSAPIVAISHSDRAAQFYETNNFCPLVRIPYVDAESKKTLFYVYVLVLDLSKTDQVIKLKGAMSDSQEENQGPS